MRTLLVLALLCSFLSCQRAEMTTLTEGEVANILLDLTISDQVISLHQPHERDSIREELMSSLLKIYDVERSELDSTLNIYMSDFERFERVSAIVKTKMDSLLREEK